MPDDFVKREEYQGAIERVHNRVDTVEKTTAQIETSAKNIEKCVCKMEKIMFGDQQADGLITKVSTLGQKVGGLYWLGGVIIVAIITSVVGISIGMMFKK